MQPTKPKKIVTIGGGTGTYTVLAGLKKHDVDLTAIVTMADSGGSTGRLRDEFGSLPVGDVRMALAALADEEYENNLLRKLFLYRFDKGNGLKGHNFGNLFLVAMTELIGSHEEAILFASRVLRIRGCVLPVTTTNSHLIAWYENGAVLRGETYIDEPPIFHDGTVRISQLGLEPEATISQLSEEAIRQADLIIMGPGDLYTSQLANVVVKGVPEAIQASQGKFVYIVNLVTKLGQTHEFSAQDHVNEVIKYTGRKPDHILINNASIPQRFLYLYHKHESAKPVLDDLARHRSVVRTDLLATEEIKRQSGDTLKRSLMRHDPDKLAGQILRLLK